MLSFDEQLLRSLNSAFIQSGGSLEDPLSPALVLNDPPRQKILGTLRNEITHCCSFDFSVAFITNEAIHMLLEELLEAKERKVHGRILTTDYLSFTDPNALTTLITKFPNIQVRIYAGAPFHAKGFIFYHDTASQIASVIIGSANLTAKALCETRELAVRFIAKKEGALLQDVQKEFSCSWQKGTEATLDWVEAYKKCRKSYLQVAIDKVQQDREETSLALVNPNSMQREALASLAQLRAQGARKALLISATGTGKTYLSALDVKAFKPQRCLFIVHRERILKDAMKSFKQILGEQYQYGLLTGSNKNTHAQFLFASIQTLSQENILSLFDRYAFDYIIVDEVQHSGGATYQQVLSHFSAQFLLGMTATPERMDGFDIYSLFDHNIAYEIRLQQAMEQKLLCPFHYFGITDISVQGQEIDDLASFRNLLSEQRVQWIVNILDKYSPCGIPRKGLFFCSRIEEAQELSKALNEHNLRTRALSGFDNDTSRLEAIQDLEQGKLEYILTVDIFNEGVDIPFLNQVVMLRPTKSVVVFVQQLGRGLRKCPSKEFLTVIDFIGNYRNNYMIPIALYGDNSGQKESIRKLVGGDSVSLAGTSTISFDEIARKKIYDSIASTSYPDLKMLKNAYTSVSQQLGRTPTMVDYTKVDSISPLLFLEKEPSYAAFKINREASESTLAIKHLQSLRFCSHVLARGIRIYEGFILSQFLQGKKKMPNSFLLEEIHKTYGFLAKKEALESAFGILSNGFFQKEECHRNGDITYCQKTEEGIQITREFSLLLENQEYVRELSDILALGEQEFRTRFLDARDENDLVINSLYSREEVCRLLCWDKDEHSTIYGYKVHHKTHTIPLFVTYKKDSGVIEKSIDYNDRFLSPSQFAWQTRNNVHLGDKDVMAMTSGKYQILLFVKKSDAENKTKFWFIGYLSSFSKKQTVITDGQGKDRPIVDMIFTLNKNVDDDTYSYLQSD